MQTTFETGVVAKALADYARSISDPAKDRAFTLGASDIGQCSRKVFFAKHDGEWNTGYVENWGATLRGQMIEQVFWAPALRARFGADLKFIGDKQRQFKRGFISATPDALLTNAPRNILSSLGVPDIGGDCLLLECKSIDPRVKLDAPKPEHRYQAIVQLGVVRETTDYEPCFGVLAYIDASFWDNVTEFAIGFDPEVYAGAKVRATKVLTANTASELPPEGWIAGGKECEHCRFSKACGIERHAVPSEGNCADPQFAAEMRELAITYKKRQAEVAVAETRLRASQHEIKERLRAKQLRRVTGDDFSVIWAPVKGRQGYDVKALSVPAAAAGVGVQEFETGTTLGDRLDVRVREARSQQQETANGER
jgi:hypothetical protein